MLINWSNQNVFNSLRLYYLLRLNEKTISLFVNYSFSLSQSGGSFG